MEEEQEKGSPSQAQQQQQQQQPQQQKLKRPTIVFEGTALELAKSVGVREALVSISHEGDYTMATVVLDSTN